MNSIAVRNERYRFTDPRLFSKTTPMAAVIQMHLRRQHLIQERQLRLQLRGGAVESRLESEPLGRHD
jgi:hypothetical protein